MTLQQFPDACAFQPAMPKSKRWVSGIPTMELHLFWPTVGPMLERAIEHGDGGIKRWQIYDALKELKLQLWVGRVGMEIEGVLVTEMQIRPTGKVCILRHACGEDAAAWIKEGLPLIQAWAKAEGATVMELQGRRGWAKIMGKPWRERWVVMQRSL